MVRSESTFGSKSQYPFTLVINNGYSDVSRGKFSLERARDIVPKIWIIG
jgi:hypothetical protein